MSIKANTKQIIIAGSANALTLYDFTLFPVLLPLIMAHFFSDSSASYIAYLSFAISFLIAPFSAIYFGHYGDSKGKAYLLKYSLIIMAIPSFIIAISPSYANIGVAASILILFMRIFQGISASAEVLGSKLYIMDYIDKKHYILASSVISAFGALGVMCAVLIGVLITKFSDIEWLWRIAFLLGSSVLIIIYFMRAPKESKKHKTSSNMLNAYKELLAHKSHIIYAFCLSAILGLLSYTLHGYMVQFAISKLGMQASTAYFLMLISLAITIASSICAGVASLYINFDRRKFLSRIILLSIPTSFTIFALIQINSNYINLAFSILPAILGIYAAVSGVEVITCFSSNLRSKGALTTNAFGVAIFGGTAPLILSILAEFGALYIGLYISIALSIFYAIILFYGKSDAVS